MTSRSAQASRCACARRRGASRRPAPRPSANPHDLAPGGTETRRRGFHGRVPGPARLRAVLEAGARPGPPRVLRSGHGRRRVGSDELDGHERFAVVGHDRGSYAAYRMALDHPDRVTRLAVLDGVPIVEALERADARFAEAWWHWFFVSSDHAERVITADPIAWYQPDRSRMGAENHEDLVAAITDPATVRAMPRTTAPACTSTGLTRGQPRLRGNSSGAPPSRPGPASTTWKTSTAIQWPSGDPGAPRGSSGRWTSPATTWRRTAPISSLDPGTVPRV